MKKKEFINILEWSCTLYVAVIMILFGVGKYWQFNGFDNDDFKGMKAMWNFYSYSKPYVITLGLLEISGGILMLIPKTRIVGCIFVSTIMINVIMQDYFYEIPALFSAITLQVIVLFILWLNRIPLIKGFRNFSTISKNINSTQKIKHIFYIIFGSIIIFAILYYLINFVNALTL